MPKKVHEVRVGGTTYSTYEHDGLLEHERRRFEVRANGVWVAASLRNTLFTGEEARDLVAGALADEMERRLGLVEAPTAPFHRVVPE